MELRRINTKSSNKLWKVLPLLALLLSGSCVKEEISVNKLDTSLDLDPALATPVGYFDFKVRDIDSNIENAKIIINEDSIVSINFSGEIRTDEAGVLYKFDAVSEDFSLANPTNSDIDLSSGDYQTDFAFKLPLFLSNTGGNSDLDSVHFSLAGFSISDIVFPPASGQIVVIIPDLKSQGEPFSTTLVPGMDQVLFDLSDYTIELTSEGGNNNLVLVEFEVFYPQQNNILYAAQPLLEFEFNLNFLEWSVIYGFLGTESIDFPQHSFDTDFEKKFPGGEFYFQDPVLQFRTINSFDIPVAMGFSAFYANTRSRGTMNISGPGVPVLPDYIYPAYPDNSAGLNEAFYNHILHRENSNLRDVIASKPESIVYNAFFETNPEGEEVQNIIFSDSKFNIQVDLLLPFYGQAKDLVIRDTLGLDLSESGIPLEDINRAIFKLYYENSYPADIRLQLYLANEDLNVIDTLFNSFSLIKGVKPTDRYRENPEVVSGEIDASISGPEINNIRQTRHIIGEALLTSVDERDDVRIFSNHNLFLNLAVIVDISTNIEDF